MSICWDTTCSRGLVAQWQRRPSADELAEQTAADLAARNAVLAAVGLPEITLDVAPSPADSTVAVHACDQHAITTALALHVHQAACTTPDPALLPGCGCTPEPLPALPPPITTVTLPTGWTIPTT